MVSITLDSTFFVQMGLFLALIYVLNLLVYKPVLKAMEERGKKIAGLESEAASIESELDYKLADYRKRIDQAKEKGGVNRTALKKDGLDKESELLAAAHAEAQETILKAKGRIGKEKEAALESLRTMTRDMGVDIAEKALGRSL
jgi:F-type H+-transporting ATPase subunit b